jgi:hypothetical protein
MDTALSSGKQHREAVLLLAHLKKAAPGGILTFGTPPMWGVLFLFAAAEIHKLFPSFISSQGVMHYLSVFSCEQSAALEAIEAAC